MNRCLALIGALLFAVISISSACTAAPADWVRFTLEPKPGGDGEIRTSFRHEYGGGENNWSSDFRPAELMGLDLAAFRAPGTRSLHFALVREAGRLDCSGQGGSSRAAGSCAFTPDPRFTQLLESRGIGRPSANQAFGLMALDVRRDLIDALDAAHYPAPSIDKLMALSAVGVDGAYIADMARAGYRPRTADALVQFKALGITPQWIGGFARIGYADLPGDELMQLKALGITPEFIAGFDRIGYRRLPVHELVQLKALDITPEFVRSVVAQGAPLPPIDQLVQVKMFGRRR